MSETIPHVNGPKLNLQFSKHLIFAFFRLAITS
jgi:hypothetical protein